MKSVAFIMTALFLCAVAAPDAALSQPPNDNFANATVLTGVSGQITGTNIDATSEPGEPYYLENSVWYSWTATESDIFYFDTVGSGSDAVLTVFTGSAVDSLTKIADSIFYAQTGTLYHIAVDGQETGNIVMNRNKVIPRTEGAFEMELSGQAFIGGKKIESSDYMIFAFGTGGVSDCRGKGNFIRFIGKWGYILTMVSDIDSEEITFKIADSSAGQLYDISDRIVFEAGSSAEKDLDRPLEVSSVYPALGEIGKSLNVTVNGFGFDGNTKVLMYPDIGNTKAVIGSVDISWPGAAYGVAVSSTTAYVGAAYSGFHVIDIKDPANPKIIGSIDTPGEANGVAVFGETAYVADWESGLQIIDVTDPANPKIIGSVDTPGEAKGVAVFGGTAYVADRDSGLQIIDVSNPAKPRIISSVDTPEYAVGIAISGNGTVAYVADFYSLQIIDVSDPTNPQIIGWTTADAQDVAVAGATAYVAGFYNGLQIIDVNDPANPQIIGSADTPGYGSGVAVSGTTAYIADGESGYLQIIDISDPAKPRIIGSVGTPGAAVGVAVSGTTAYVAALGSGLQIIDVSNPTRFQMINTGLIATPGVAQDVAVYGTTAYVAAMADMGVSGSGGLHIIDISNPAKPNILGSFVTPGDRAFNVAVSGTTAFVADANSENLQIIDVSNPAKPQITHSVTMLGFPQDVAVSVSGTTAYVACGKYEYEGKDGWKGLQIIDISNPATPRIIASVPTPGYAQSVAVSGTTVYVGCGEYNQWEGLQIIDVSDPANPKIIGSVATPGPLYSVAVSGTIVYALDAATLRVTDVKDPANPQIIASVDIPGFGAVDVAVSLSGAIAYVTCRNGLQIIDVNDPAKPQKAFKN